MSVLAVYCILEGISSFIGGPHENSRSNFIFSMLALFSIVMHPVINMIRVIKSNNGFMFFVLETYT